MQSRPHSVSDDSPFRVCTLIDSRFGTTELYGNEMIIRQIKTGLLGLLMLGLLPFCPAYGAEDLLIIANRSIPVDGLKRTTVANIYKAEETKWNNGETIIVVMHKKGLIHNKFAQDIVGITHTRLRDIWRKVIFTGLGRPPRIFRNEPDLVEYVSKTNGAIGYISASTPHKGVKVISIK